MTGKGDWKLQKGRTSHVGSNLKLALLTSKCFSPEPPAYSEYVKPLAIPTPFFASLKCHTFNECSEHAVPYHVWLPDVPTSQQLFCQCHIFDVWSFVLKAATSGRLLSNLLGLSVAMQAIVKMFFNALPPRICLKVSMTCCFASLNHSEGQTNHVFDWVCLQQQILSLPSKNHQKTEDLCSFALLLIDAVFLPLSIAWNWRMGFETISSAILSISIYVTGRKRWNQRFFQEMIEI